MNSVGRTRSIWIAMVVAVVTLTSALLVPSWLSSVKASVMQNSAKHNSRMSQTVIQSIDGVPFDNFGMTFQAQTPQAGSDISESTALSKAESYESSFVTGGVPNSGVNIEYDFGLWSSSELATLDSNGNQQLEYQNVPVWVVSFSGPGFSATMPDGLQVGRQTVIIDGTTAKALGIFS